MDVESHDAKNLHQERVCVVFVSCCLVLSCVQTDDKKRRAEILRTGKKKKKKKKKKTKKTMKQNPLAFHTHIAVFHTMIQKTSKTQQTSSVQSVLKNIKEKETEAYPCVCLFAFNKLELHIHEEEHIYHI